MSKKKAVVADEAATAQKREEALAEAEELESSEVEAELEEEESAVKPKAKKPEAAAKGKPKAVKVVKGKPAPKPKAAVKPKPKAERPEGRDTKKSAVLAMLSAKAGCTMDELVAETGWQRHSARGFLSMTKNKGGANLQSKVVDGVRRYRITK